MEHSTSRPCSASPRHWAAAPRAQGDWYCAACEQQLQSAILRRGTAGRLLGLALQRPESRALLTAHADFPGMQQARAAAAATACLLRPGSSMMMIYVL